MFLHKRISIQVASGYNFSLKDNVDKSLSQVRLTPNQPTMIWQGHKHNSKYKRKQNINIYKNGRRYDTLCRGFGGLCEKITVMYMGKVSYRHLNIVDNTSGSDWNIYGGRLNFEKKNRNFNNSVPNTRRAWIITLCCPIEDPWKLFVAGAGAHFYVYKPLAVFKITTI